VPGRQPVQNRADRVVAGHGNSQPVQHRAVDPDRRPGGSGDGQAKAEPGGEVPGSGAAADLDPRRRGLGRQFASVGLGHLDVHAGHRGPGRAEQPGAEFLGDSGGHGHAIQLVDQLRQRAAAGPIAMQQPDRHRAVAGVVGEHDQVAHDEDPPVADLPWPWPGVRDANGD
jgi:hypothetical protein